VNPGSGSALAREGVVYALNGSVLVTADLLSGEEGWKLRLPDAGQLWATPVIAGDMLYAFTQDGDCFVVKLPSSKDGKGEVVARNTLGEAVYGTPAISGNALYVRSYDHLWKIAN
jgi:outer membrane protein assembly factor BamB